MADTTQGDTDGQYLTLLVLALIALIAGLLIHSFIIGVNVTDWWKGRSVTPVDHIVTSLGMSRMGAQFINTLNLCMNTVLLSSPDSYINVIIICAFYALFIYANFWLTSLLFIVFCLKISNLHTKLFLYLRGLILHRTGYLIVASVLFSAFNGLNPLFTVIKVINVTDHLLIHSIYNVTIGTFIPLLFYCISSVFIFTSLYHHTTKMKMSSNLSINLETYYSVMRFLSVTFIYNTLYFTGHLSSMYCFFFHRVNLRWLYIVLEFLPVLHSSYLIYRTAKLRSQMSKVFQIVIDFLSPQKDPETREHIEVVAL